VQQALAPGLGLDVQGKVCRGRCAGGYLIKGYLPDATRCVESEIQQQLDVSARQAMCAFIGAAQLMGCTAGGWYWDFHHAGWIWQ
jgi:hypothetical protein